MKRSTAIFLQTATALLGIAVFAFLLWEPTVEGRNAHATLFEVYFHDPFLAYAYAGSTPFFVALYRAFGLFADAGRNKPFSPRALSALRVIRYCAIAVIGFILAGEAYLFTMGGDDIAGGVAMGALVASFCAAAAAAAALFEARISRNEA